MVINIIPSLSQQPEQQKKSGEGADVLNRLSAESRKEMEHCLLGWF